MILSPSLNLNQWLLSHLAIPCLLQWVISSVSPHYCWLVTVLVLYHQFLSGLVYLIPSHGSFLLQYASVATPDGILVKESTFLSPGFSWFYLLTVCTLAQAVFQATQDFYQQGISMQKATARSCSVSPLEVGLISFSSNVLQAIYSLENTAHNYRDATEEHDRLTAIYKAKTTSRSTR